jgi:D-alanyl-lipoteichoic acid acyltransferase DltB (MBOAT superfamily)
MLFNSYAFIFAFLPITCIGYFALARFGRRPSILWLIAASLLFYGWWNPPFLAVLALSITVNYTMSELIGRAQPGSARQNWILGIAIAANLGALAYYKYLFAVVQVINAHTGWQWHFDEVVLPIGISFFTFTQIGYLLDVKQGMAEERGLLNYVLFVTFFPHLVAGPILHNREMMPQYANKETYRVSSENLAIGASLFIMGLAKKVLLADPHSGIVGQGFSNAANLSFSDAWFTALSYSLQLYFDFSGYSDMAIGLARMFNIVFPVNFNSPFKSASIIEYWQRWHITLTNYLNLYLYNPIAMAIMRRRMAQGQDVSKRAYLTLGGFSSMVLAPTFITMGLAGLWHGAGSQFIIFGLLHATFLSVNNAWRMYRTPIKKARGIKSDPRWKHAAKVLLTYVTVIIAVIFFRSPSTAAALDLLSAMAGLHSGQASMLLPRGQLPLSTLLFLVTSYVIIWGLPNSQQILANFKPVLERVMPARPIWLQWHPNASWALGLGLLGAIAVLATGGTSEFLYFQF